MQPTLLALLAPDTLFHGRYLVVRSIRRGGMGEVYEVKDQNTKRPRALKVMLPEALENTDLRHRFDQEATITGGIESDHIVQVSDAGIDAASGMPFIVMDLLRGEEIAAISARVGALLPDDVVLYLKQVALALDKTHAAGIVHRDLKPENLFLTRRDDNTPCVKILDFGIAKLTVHNTLTGRTALIGTPLYMAPEQIRGGRIGPATDLYALGHVAYTLLTGGAYWTPEATKARALYALFENILAGPREVPSIRAARQNVTLPQTFDAWFARATAPEASQRFERATDGVALLEEALRPPTVHPPPPAPPSGDRYQDTPPTEPLPQGRSDPPVPVAPVPRPLNPEPGRPAAMSNTGLLVTGAKSPRLRGALLRLIFRTTYMGLDKKDCIQLSFTRPSDALACFTRRKGRWFFESTGSLDFLNGKLVAGEAPLKGGDQLWIRTFELKFIDDSAELRHHEEQYKLAWCDELTRAFNRHYLEEELSEAHRDATRASKDLSVLILDMKPLQGERGKLTQAETDPLIQQLARTARSYLPNGGTLARLHSDTLVLLLPGVHPVDATELAARLAQEARERLGKFPQAARVKVRVGIAHRQPSDRQGRDLLERASRALS